MKRRQACINRVLSYVGGGGYDDDYGDNDQAAVVYEYIQATPGTVIPAPGMTGSAGGPIAVGGGGGGIVVGGGGGGRGFGSNFIQPDPLRDMVNQRARGNMTSEKDGYIVYKERAIQDLISKVQEYSNQLAQHSQPLHRDGIMRYVDAHTLSPQGYGARYNLNDTYNVPMTVTDKMCLTTALTQAERRRYPHGHGNREQHDEDNRRHTAVALAQLNVSFMRMRNLLEHHGWIAKELIPPTPIPNNVPRRTTSKAQTLENNIQQSVQENTVNHCPLNDVLLWVEHAHVYKQYMHTPAISTSWHSEAAKWTRLYKQRGRTWTRAEWIKEIFPLRDNTIVLWESDEIYGDNTGFTVSTLLRLLTGYHMIIKMLVPKGGLMEDEVREAVVEFKEFMLWRTVYVDPHLYWWLFLRGIVYPMVFSVEEKSSQRQIVLEKNVFDPADPGTDFRNMYAAERREYDDSNTPPPSLFVFNDAENQFLTESVHAGGGNGVMRKFLADKPMRVSGIPTGPTDADRTGYKLLDERTTTVIKLAVNLIAVRAHTDEHIQKVIVSVDANDHNMIGKGIFDTAESVRGFIITELQKALNDKQRIFEFVPAQIVARINGGVIKQDKIDEAKKILGILVLRYMVESRDHHAMPIELEEALNNTLVHNMLRLLPANVDLKTLWSGRFRYTDVDFDERRMNVLYWHAQKLVQSSPRGVSSNAVRKMHKKMSESPDDELHRFINKFQPMTEDQIQQATINVLELFQETKINGVDVHPYLLSLREDHKTVYDWNKLLAKLAQNTRVVPVPDRSDMLVPTVKPDDPNYKTRKVRMMERMWYDGLFIHKTKGSGSLADILLYSFYGNTDDKKNSSTMIRTLMIDRLLSRQEQTGEKKQLLEKCYQSITKANSTKTVTEYHGNLPLPYHFLFVFGAVFDFEVHLYVLDKSLVGRAEAPGQRPYEIIMYNDKQGNLPVIRMFMEQLPRTTNASYYPIFSNGKQVPTVMFEGLASAPAKVAYLSHDLVE